MGCVEATTVNDAGGDNMEVYTCKLTKIPRGMHLDNNLYVVKLSTYCQAERKGVTIGSQVIALNGQTVKGKSTIKKIANASLPLKITFIRPKIIVPAPKPRPTTPFKLSTILELDFYIQTPPILNGKQVILMHTNNKTKQTKYCVLDINKQEIIKNEIDIKCDDTFDVFNTVYALNQRKNTVYFIENNRDILKWDLNGNNNNTIVSLNKSITTTKDNSANIIYVNDEIHIFGAEPPSNEDGNYFLISYSPCRWIKSTGQFSRMINIQFDGVKYVLMLGGQIKHYLCPSNELWRYPILSHSKMIVCKCLNSFVNFNMTIPSSIVCLIYQFYYDQSNCKWNQHIMCVPRWMDSFGVINYKNRYLFLFGGRSVNRSKGNLQEKTNRIFVLPLQDNENNLRKGMWYRLARKLSEKDCFHAIYNGGEIVHLFAYSGVYYTINIKDILNDLMVDEWVHPFFHWTEMHPLYVGEPFPVQHMGVKSDLNPTF